MSDLRELSVKYTVKELLCAMDDRSTENFAGVHDRLDKLNGRVREAEKKGASHEARIDEHDKQHTATPTRKNAAAVAVGSGAGVYAVFEFGARILEWLSK